MLRRPTTSSLSAARRSVGTALIARVHWLKVAGSVFAAGLAFGATAFRAAAIGIRIFSTPWRLRQEEFARCQGIEVGEVDLRGLELRCQGRPGGRVFLPADQGQVLVGEQRALQRPGVAQGGDEQVECPLAPPLGKLVDDVGCLADPVAAAPARAEQLALVDHHEDGLPLQIGGVENGAAERHEFAGVSGVDHEGRLISSGQRIPKRVRIGDGIAVE